MKVICLFIAILCVGCMSDPQDPSLRDQAAFAFFATSGTFTVYKEGKIVEKQALNDLQDGSLKFFFLQNSRAMILGNQGSGVDLEVHRMPMSISIVEHALIGDHIFTVYDEWLPEHRGFRSTYHRTVVFGEVMRSEYSGFSRLPYPAEPVQNSPFEIPDWAEPVAPAREASLAPPFARPKSGEPPSLERKGARPPSLKLRGAPPSFKPPFAKPGRS